MAQLNIGIIGAGYIGNVHAKILARDERVRVAAFYDMGNVYYETFDFDLGEFSANVGIGLRLNLPIGPLRLDYGYPVREANNEADGGQFNFSVGYTREF